MGNGDKFHQKSFTPNIDCEKDNPCKSEWPNNVKKETKEKEETDESKSQAITE